MARIVLTLLALFLMFSLRAQTLPVVKITGELGDEYAPGVIEVFGNPDEPWYSTPMKFKVRGATSRRYEKKSMAVKLLDENGEKLDHSFFGMRSDNSWILDAMAVDKARMRNRVSFDLWNDMAADSYVMEEYEGESMHGISGKFVELYLNGKYHGIYCLNEKLDRKQLKLKKKKGDEIRGLLYKANSWDCTTYASYKPQYDNSSETWAGWECQYPDIEDDGDTDWKPLIDNIAFVRDADSETFCNEVEERFDLPVIRDYIIFYIFINAQDNYGKNQFAYFYDIRNDKRQGLAPWDLDATWGRGYESSVLEPSQMLSLNRLYQRLLTEKPGFSEELQRRYKTLRRTWLDSDRLKKRFNDYFDMLRKCGALKRETERWSGVDGIHLDFETERYFIAGWLDYHIRHVDTFFQEELPTAISEPKAMPKTNRLYAMDGRLVMENATPEAIRQSGLRGIYIMDGRKITIK